MFKLFVGRDPVEIVGFHVFVESVLDQTNPNKVQIIPISGHKGTASNIFNIDRFRVPERCGYKGRAAFADGSDMLCRTDILALADQLEEGCDLAVVKHEYSTKHPTKFLGQPNEDYPRKNQSSLMVFECGNTIWRNPSFTEMLKAGKPGPLHRFQFIKHEERIGELDKEWNWLVGEYEYNPNAKIAHFTIGLPCWPAYKNCDYADEWRDYLKKANHFQQWSTEAYDDSPLVSER
jgi:hypothetical protein